MYFIAVLLLGFVLPIGSVVAEHSYFHAAAPWIALAGKWFVFWAAGVRLGIAGIRQQARPKLTSQGIFGIASDDPLPFVRELGVANLAAATVALLSPWRPDFVLPAAISAGVFYTLAGIWHMTHAHRSANQNLALVTDLILGAIFAVYVAMTLTHGA